MIELMTTVPLGVFDFVNEKAGELTSTMNVVVVAIAILFFAVVAIKGKFSIASLITGGFVAALAIWLVPGGGIEWLSGLVGDEAA